MGASTCWNPQGLSRPVVGLLYLPSHRKFPSLPSYTEWLVTVLLCDVTAEMEMRCNGRAPAPPPTGATHFLTISLPCAGMPFKHFVVCPVPQCVHHLDINSLPFLMTLSRFVLTFHWQQPSPPCAQTFASRPD